MFKKPQDSKPELQQQEREAIVDLLHFCVYADSHIALKEGAFLSQVVDVIGWETRSSFSSYEARSISKARAAKENADEKRALLESVAARLGEKPVRDLAVDLCRQLFAVDGSTEQKEFGLLGEIRSAMKA